ETEYWMAVKQQGDNRRYLCLSAGFAMSFYLQSFLLHFRKSTCFYGIIKIFAMKIVGDDKGDWRCPLVAEYVEWMDGCLAGMMAATCFTMMILKQITVRWGIPYKKIGVLMLWKHGGVERLGDYRGLWFSSWVEIATVLSVTF
ncbi:hypothetical protein D5086_025282, partial [Populus alba]